MKIGLGIGIPRQQSSSGGGASFDTDYQALLDAASGDLPTESTQTAQNTLVVDLKAAGVWAKLDLLYVFATDGGDDIRRRNWKAPASFQATLISNPLFTSLEGYTGDRSADYIDTNWNPSTDAVNFQQNNASIGVYQRSNAGTLEAMFGADDSTSFISATWNRGVGELVAINSTSEINTGTLTAIGLNWLDRANSTQFSIYSNGSVFDSAYSSTSTPPPNINVFVLAKNVSGITQRYSRDQVSIFFAGASLASEAAAFFTAVEKYMDAIGKGVVA